MATDVQGWIRYISQNIDKPRYLYAQLAATFAKFTVHGPLLLCDTLDFGWIISTFLKVVHI